MVTSGDEDSSVHYDFRPCKESSIAETYLEVVAGSDGWYGFRSSAAGGRFLQARRHGGNKLSFFSANLGTWEQWNIEEPENFNERWSTINIIISNRRLPQLKISVEICRVGRLGMQSKAVTSHSIPNILEDNLREDEQLERISGAFMDEWIQFVNHEKGIRQNQEAKVAAAIQETAALKSWAIEKIQSLQDEADEGVDKLIAAVKVKNSLLLNVRVQLENRVRWGIALLIAQREADRKRADFVAWRLWTSRKKYCNKVEAKFVERSALERKSRVFASWAECWQMSRVRHLRLRAAVRRMAYLRLHHAFQSWREYTIEKRMMEAAEVESTLAACRYLRSLKAHRVLDRWRTSAREAAWGRSLLRGVGSRIQIQTLETIFSAWRLKISLFSHNVSKLEERVVLTSSMRCLKTVFNSWRRAVDGEILRRRQLVQAIAVVERARLRCAFNVMHQYCNERKAGRALMESRITSKCIKFAFTSWRQAAAAQRQQAVSVLAFVDFRAQSLQLLSLQYWQFYISSKKRHHNLVERSVQKIGRNLIAAAFSSWKVHVAKVRWLKYREDQIMSRHKDRLLSRVLSNWKDATSSAVVQVTVAEDKYRQKVQTIVLKSFLVLKEHCTEQAIVRDKLFKSVNMHVDTLQRKAFNALILSAQQRQKFEMSLSGIHATIEFESAKLVLTAWRTLAAARSRKRYEYAHLQRTFKSRALRLTFMSWRAETEYQHALDGNIEVMHKQQTLTFFGDCFVAWRTCAADMASRRKRAIDKALRGDKMLTHDAIEIWGAYTLHQQKRRSQLSRATWRMTLFHGRLAFKAWRRRIAALSEGRRLGEEMKKRIEGRGNMKSRLNSFDAWRSMTERLKISRAAVDARHAAHACGTGRLILTAWSNYTRQKVRQRDRVLVISVSRRTYDIQSRTLDAWLGYAQAGARSRAVGIRAVERLSIRTMAVSFIAWKEAAKARRTRRTTLVRFIQRWNTMRQATTFGAWHEVLVENKARIDTLNQCLVRKQIAFRTFKSWYWESFESNLQETLRGLFDITEASPDHTQPGSPSGASTPGTPGEDGLYGLGPEQQKKLADELAAKLSAVKGERKSIAARVQEVLNENVDATDAAVAASTPSVSHARGLADAPTPGSALFKCLSSMKRADENALADAETPMGSMVPSLMGHHPTPNSLSLGTISSVRGAVPSPGWSADKYATALTPGWSSNKLFSRIPRPRSAVASTPLAAKTPASTYSGLTGRCTMNALIENMATPGDSILYSHGSRTGLSDKATPVSMRTNPLGFLSP